MKVAIHQPQYLPWLGYFEKMDHADLFVFLDNVQFKKNEWQNRNRIRTPEGWQWITVPVLHRFGQRIDEVRINNTVDWRRKHSQALCLNYGRAPFFSRYWGGFDELLQKPWEGLAELNISVSMFLAESMGIRRPVFRASTLEAPEGSTERLVRICQILGASTYLSGRDGAKYLDLDRFREAGVGVEFQDYQHPAYQQCYNPFYPFLSVFDLLVNQGERSLSILRGGSRWGGEEAGTQSRGRQG